MKRNYTPVGKRMAPYLATAAAFFSPTGLEARADQTPLPEQETCQTVEECRQELVGLRQELGNYQGLSEKVTDMEGTLDSVFKVTGSMLFMMVGGAIGETILRSRRGGRD
ncbi:MAG: hypothetical protein ABIB79_04455 [archaeon]